MSAIPKIEIKETKVICGELCESNACSSETVNLVNIETESIAANISTKFDKFVDRPEALEDRITDLLQIAAFVFCADRQRNRGNRERLSNNAWARSFYFNIPVNDVDFWSREDVVTALKDALVFMTGDRQFHFSFVKATVNVLKDRSYQLSFFSEKALNISEETEVDVMLFSGGLDSLAGAIERLNQYPDRKLCLVSHVSNNRITKTQQTLVEALRKKYGERVYLYSFGCNFMKIQSKEESQRTRMFLFSAIAFAISRSCRTSEFFVFENGITSINLPKQEDVINARASRTTHPKTLGLLQKFYRLFDANFRINSPYKRLTKEEIVNVFKRYEDEVLIQSSISCSATRENREIASHCGCCSQCIDRRFAMYAAGLANDYDNTYAINEQNDELNDDAKQRISNTVMFANEGIGDSKFDFLKKYPTEIMSAICFWDTSPEESFEEIFTLYTKYKDSIKRAEIAMEDRYGNSVLMEGSLFSYIDHKKMHDLHKKQEFELCVESSVYVIEQDDGSRQGTGFFLSDYGILTSYHLIEKGDLYNISKYNDYPRIFIIIDRKMHTACEDTILDYSLYNVIDNCESFFQIGDSDTLNLGDSLTLISFPLFCAGASYDLCHVEIRQKTRYLNAPLYAVNHAILHGASGGLVLDRNNLIVGLIRAGIESCEDETSSKCGFVPINLILNDIQSKGG